MEQREDADHPFLARFRVGRPQADLLGIGVETGVTELCTFGKAGGAAGILLDGDVGAWIDRHRLEFAVIGGQFLEGGVMLVMSDVGDLLAS